CSSASGCSGSTGGGGAKPKGRGGRRGGPGGPAPGPRSPEEGGMAPRRREVVLMGGGWVPALAAAGGARCGPQAGRARGGDGRRRRDGFRAVHPPRRADLRGALLDGPRSPPPPGGRGARSAALSYCSCVVPETVHRPNTGLVVKDARRWSVAADGVGRGSE